MAPTQTTESTGTEPGICWICLSGEEAGELSRPCPCPRLCHMECLARWQLQSAGRKEEHTCRFCQHSLPAWKDHLTPPDLKPLVHENKSNPFMAVVFNGQMYKIPVRPGADGMAEFKARVKLLFGFSMNSDFDVTFECKAPTASGEKLMLRGLDCYDAATHCAAISAAQRVVSEGAGSPANSGTAAAHPAAAAAQ